MECLGKSRHSSNAGSKKVFLFIRFNIWSRKNSARYLLLMFMYARKKFHYLVGNGNSWKSFYEKFLSRFAYKKGYSISVLQPECVFSVFHIKGYGRLCYALSFRVVESHTIYFSCFSGKKTEKSLGLSK